MTLTAYPLRSQVSLTHELLYLLPQQAYILFNGMLLITLFHYLDFYIGKFTLTCLPWQITDS